MIERGMARQGYDLQLTRYANEGWRATFYVASREHSVTQGDGLGLGADTLVRGARGGVGGIEEARSHWLKSRALQLLQETL